MIPLAAADRTALSAVEYVLCDLDDTLTIEGRLPAIAYASLERLSEDGISVVVVTGRPAGWCDMIARFWPVSAVVGENGAFAFRFDRQSRRMVRHFQRDEATRARDRNTLFALYERIREEHPDAPLSADQSYRTSDIAIDFCEDVAPLPRAKVDAIVAMLQAGGATARISSIHVNAWIGDFSKLDMASRLLKGDFGLTESEMLRTCLYVGDSPNDEPMFAHFPLSVGVANVVRFAGEMRALPRWITAEPGGYGFAELAELLRPKSA